MKAKNVSENLMANTVRDHNQDLMKFKQHLILSKDFKIINQNIEEKGSFNACFSLPFERTMMRCS